MKNIYCMFLLSITSSLWSMNNPMSIAAICNDQDEDITIRLKKEDEATIIAATVLSDMHNESYRYVSYCIEAEMQQRTDEYWKKIVLKNGKICPVCNNAFRRRLDTYNHAVRCHNVCLDCEIPFSSRDIIIMHMIKYHTSKASLIRKRIDRIKDESIKNIMRDLLNQTLKSDEPMI